MRPIILTFALALLLAPALASAQATPSAVEADDDKDGTTVMGDRESPIGLLIAPWREATPEANLDRPVRFLQEELIPIDAEVFRRQVEYFYTIASHLRSRGVAGYADALPPAPASSDATAVGAPPINPSPDAQ